MASLDATHLLYLDERGTRKVPEACDDNECPGWYLDGEAVVRCAECERFKDDLSARGHVRRALKMKSTLDSAPVDVAGSDS